MAILSPSHISYFTVFLTFNQWLPPNEYLIFIWDNIDRTPALELLFRRYTIPVMGLFV